MSTKTTAEKDEELAEEQIHTVVLDGVELHHLKMIALRYLEEHAEISQILRETLTEQQAVMRRVYDIAHTAQDHRQNSDDISQYDDIRMRVRAADVTAVMTVLGEYSEAPVIALADLP